jgi:hypothetical protein
MLYLMVGCLSRSQEKASPRKMGLFPNGGIWKVWKFELFENWSVLNPQFFVKSCSFLRTEIANLPSNFTGNTMQCISIDWYPETCIYMLYESVHKRSLSTQSWRKQKFFQSLQAPFFVPPTPVDGWIASNNRRFCIKPATHSPSSNL